MKRLLWHAYMYVPYYGKLFAEMRATPDDIRSFCDFSRIPILTKDLIRNNFAAIQADNWPRSSFIKNSTGGSTGEPLQFFHDKSYELWADAARLRGWYDIAGADLGESCAILWGAVRDIHNDYSIFDRMKDYLISGEIYLNAFNLSNMRKEKFLNLCRYLRPRLLRGYVTAIRDFARYLEESGKSFPKIKGIILAAETVDPEIQEYIEQIFDAPSYNTYGGRELSLIAMECKCKNGLHETSENNYVEFEDIDIDGLKDCGNVIVTNLNNYAMPFIRYRIGDIGIKSKLNQCACGRGLPLIERIIGRSTDIFKFKDGTKIAGEMFIHLMKEFPIEEYQFIQNSYTKITLRTTCKKILDAELRDVIGATYRRYLPDGVTLIVEVVDNIRKTATGKFRFVYSDI